MREITDPHERELNDRHWRDRFIPGIVDDIVADKTMFFEEALRLVTGVVPTLGNRNCLRAISGETITTLTDAIKKLTEMRDEFEYILALGKKKHSN